VEKVFTYFQDFGSKNSYLHLQLIDIFIKNWQEYDFQVEVLSEVDAKKSPLYKSFKKIVSAYPTVNSKQYEQACFLRWLALAEVGGTFLTDYDVMNFGFHAENYRHIISDHSYTGNVRIINFDVGRVPCAVHVEGALEPNGLIAILSNKNLARKSETKINGLRHVSDMHMFANLKIGDSIEFCHLAEHSFPLRHYSSDSTGGGMESKLEIVKSHLSSP
jgi:hypothetical protein